VYIYVGLKEHPRNIFWWLKLLNTTCVLYGMLLLVSGYKRLLTEIVTYLFSVYMY
jgi:hypothetical protein